MKNNKTIQYNKDILLSRQSPRAIDLHQCVLAIPLVKLPLSANETKKER